jgi:hypothetical protein
MMYKKNEKINNLKRRNAKNILPSTISSLAYPEIDSFLAARLEQRFKGESRGEEEV